MADLFTVTAPLALRLPDGGRKVIAACFPHPLGLLYLDIFWHLSTPDQAAHLIRGEPSGEGPWKIGGCVLTVLGCHHTDPELAEPFARWREYLETQGADYPPPEQIRAIARRLGAAV
ncbi:MAG: hypothetical protein MUC77_03795 [Chromatiaceae bacterium]|nr:hypothetical protein [Chromatiaceae bacterium]